MPDRWNGQIWMGGELSRTKDSQADPETSVLDALISMINDSGASHEWGDAAANIKTAEGLDQYLDDDGLINLKDHQATNGEFEELETFCRENGIPYSRVSESYCENQAEEVWWLPGMKEYSHRYLDSDEQHIIRTASLDTIKELLKVALAESPLRDKCDSWKKVKIALAKINELDRFPPNFAAFKVVA